MYNFSYAHVACASKEALNKMFEASGKPVDGCYPTTVPKVNHKEEAKMGTGRPEDPSCQFENLLAKSFLFFLVFLI